MNSLNCFSIGLIILDGKSNSPLIISNFQEMYILNPHDTPKSRQQCLKFECAKPQAKTPCKLQTRDEPTLQSGRLSCAFISACYLSSDEVKLLPVTRSCPFFSLK